VWTARKLIDLVGSTDKHFEIAPGGHMGVILGSRAQHAVWASSANWLDKRSGTKKTVVASLRPKAKSSVARPRKAAVKRAAK
jgi:polyhydroxyalkanoate synthase